MHVEFENKQLFLSSVLGTGKTIKLSDWPYPEQADSAIEQGAKALFRTTSRLSVFVSSSELLRFQRLWIGERLLVLDGAAMHDVSHRKLGDLARFGARNVGDGDDFCRHVARARPSADFRGCVFARSESS